MARPRLYHVLDGHKECSRCHTPKLLAEFGKSAKASDGHQAECKLCHSGRYEKAPRYPRDLSVIDKECSQCAQRKPAGEFYDDPLVPTGIKAACKACIDPAKKRWTLANPEKRKTIANRWFRKAYADPEKREVFTIKVEEWREANPDKVRKHRATDMAKNGHKPARVAKRRSTIQQFFKDRPGYRAAAAHKRRALIKRAPIVDAMINVWVLYERDKGICTLCMHPVDKTLRWPDLRIATIDHVIPVTRGGEHSYRNTKLAHHCCNTTKNNRFETPQLLAAIRKRYEQTYGKPGEQLSFI